MIVSVLGPNTSSVLGSHFEAVSDDKGSVVDRAQEHYY